MYTHSLIYAISAWIILIDPVASQCVPISADGSTVPGRTLATEDQTAAIGVWYKNVTSDAISTHSVCALVSTGDCAGLVDNMKATLAAILASLVMTAPPSDTESATGVPLSARRLKTGHLSKALLKDVLGKGDITFDNVWVKDGPTHRRSAGTGNTSTTFHVDGVSSQDGSKTNITLQQLDDTTGQALVVHAGSSTNHNARDIGHDPGIKVSYKLYPENLRKSVSPEDASKLAESMAKDWATRSDEVQTAANYLGLFQQRLGIIAGIELIPNYKGFGLNWEDPNAVCGSLDNYACNLGEKQCDAIAKVPPGSPMSDTTTMDTTSSASSGTTTATTSSKETAATTSDGTTTTTTPTDATKGTGITTAVDGTPSKMASDTVECSVNVVNSRLVEWWFHVGLPYRDWSCDDIHKAIERQIEPASVDDGDYNCAPDSNSQTIIKFTVNYNGTTDVDDLNDRVLMAMSEMYPNIEAFKKENVNLSEGKPCCSGGYGAGQTPCR